MFNIIETLTEPFHMQSTTRLSQQGTSLQCELAAAICSEGSVING